MADNSIGIVLTADSKGVDKALAEMQAQVDKLGDKLAAAGKKGAEGGKSITEGMDASGKAVGGLTQGLQMMAVQAGASVSVVMQLAKAWEELKQRQEAARETAVGAAEAIAAARLNFQADATVGEAQLEPELQRIARARGVSVASVAGAASNAFSAGAKDNRAALAAVEAGFGLSPDQATATELAGRAIDLGKLTGADSRAALGFLLNTGRAARVTDLRKLGQSGLPAINAVMAQGDTAEQGAELFATMTQMLADTEGSVSKTATTALAERLGSFVPKAKAKDDRGAFNVPADQMAAFSAATSTAARIEAMQNNPELRRAFFASNSFGTESSAVVKALLSGDATAVGLLRQAQAGIGALDARQIGAFDEKVQSIERGRFSPIADLERQSRANAEGFRLDDSMGQRTAAVRKVLDETLQTIGTNFVARGAGKFSFEAEALLGEAPEAAASRRLRTERAMVEGRAANPSVSAEQRAVDAQTIQYLDRQLKTLAEALERNTRATERNSEGVNDPGRPAAPRPSAALSR